MGDQTARWNEDTQAWEYVETPGPKAKAPTARFEAFRDLYAFNTQLVLTHKPSGRAYRLLGPVIREHDLVPCAIYRSLDDGVLWCRPLAEILYSYRWGWGAHDETIIEELRAALRAYSQEEK